MNSKQSKNAVSRLINPLTNEYNQLKSIILSPRFNWNYLPCNVPEDNSGYNNFGFYHHETLQRKETRTHTSSPYLKQSLIVFKQILTHNNIPHSSPYRISFNSTHPTHNNNIPSPPHVDHHYPHDNLIVYLTPIYGGHTLVQRIPQPMEEDGILLFNGEHNLYPPSEQRRVVIVYTFPQVAEKVVEKPVENKYL